MDKSLRNVMNIVDEHKDKIPEGAYIEICNNLRDIRRIYSGVCIRKNVDRVGRFLKMIIYVGIGTIMREKIAKK
jgi:hypothetical protein|tara:strand:+ start:521 stop:742 length:222 start_codon:yes stop_codon:yes gene_type:complete